MFTCINKNFFHFLGEELNPFFTSYLNFGLSAIISLISFLSLFMTISYQNKFEEASMRLYSIIYPNEISGLEFKKNIIEFSILSKRNKIIVFLYVTLIVTTTILILTFFLFINNGMHFIVADLKLTDISFTVLSVLIYFIIVAVFIFATIFSERLYNRIDTKSGKPFPKIGEIRNFDYFLKHHPDSIKFFPWEFEFSIYKNIYGAKEKYDFSLYSPWVLNNLRFVFEICQGEDVFRLEYVHREEDLDEIDKGLLYGEENRDKVEHAFRLLTDKDNIDAKFWVADSDGKTIAIKTIEFTCEREDMISIRPKGMRPVFEKHAELRKLDMENKTRCDIYWESKP